MSGLHMFLAACGLLGLIFMALSANVSRQRWKTSVSLGAGDGSKQHRILHQAIRAQANFAEYVPLILILLAFDFYQGLPASWLAVLLVALLAARILHPFGLYRRPPNFQRGAGMLLTWAVLVIASLAALYLAI